MEDIVVYYYFIKQVDCIYITKEYKKLYNDVITYLPILNDSYQFYVINYIDKNIKHSRGSKWLGKLKSFVNTINF